MPLLLESGTFGGVARLVQSPGSVGIHYDAGQGQGFSRIIPITDQPHLPQHMRQRYGDARAHWEGDTLVVDVSAFNGQSWFDRAGNFHSDALHVVERYTPMGPDHLLYEATIEDPNLFTRPWNISLPLYRRVEENVELMEFKCIEFVEEKLYRHLRRQPED